LDKEWVKYLEEATKICESSSMKETIRKHKCRSYASGSRRERALPCLDSEREKQGRHPVKVNGGWWTYSVQNLHSGNRGKGIQMRTVKRENCFQELEPTATELGLFGHHLKRAGR